MHAKDKTLWSATLSVESIKQASIRLYKALSSDEHLDPLPATPSIQSQHTQERKPPSRRAFSEPQQKRRRVLIDAVRFENLPEATFKNENDCENFEKARNSTERSSNPVRNKEEISFGYTQSVKSTRPTPVQDQLLLKLMKLRLNFDNKHLAHLFLISAQDFQFGPAGKLS
ncbi:hypothetical protein KUTeg_018688 [Tegillarca granosa]|uniref:Transposase Helix-turn-helix domain-containing protein n=1 Tax=Tegillarca granosa TaxID=220873 RepID=A0ABQ9EK41_TEGGR|nr:hypothetical protein KUTeg_018688 [Tegillarca granosa]